MTNMGFQGDDHQMFQEALDSTDGFTWVLTGAKAFPEYGIELNLVRDRYPKKLGCMIGCEGELPSLHEKAVVVRVVDYFSRLLDDASENL